MSAWHGKRKRSKAEVLARESWLEQKQAEADAMACDALLDDLRRHHPKGPPRDLSFRPTPPARYFRQPIGSLVGSHAAACAAEGEG